jgi:hypothetical protein
MIGQAQRDVLVGQHPQDARLIPARMTEFETVTPLPRQQLEEAGEAVRVGLKLRRELEQDRAGLAAEP